MNNRIKHIIKTLLQLLLTLTIFVYITYKFDINIVDILEKLDVKYLIIAILIRVFIMPVISINRWKLFLKYSGVNESFFMLLKISLVSSFFGIILPSSQGTDIMRMVMIEKRCKEKNVKINSTSSATVLIERMIGFVLLALIGFIASVIIDYPNKLYVTGLIGCINLFLFLIIIVVTNKRIYFFTKGILEKIKIMRNIINYVDKLYYSIIIFPFKKILFSSVCLILLFQLCTILVAFCIFKAFSVDLTFIQHLAFYPLITILSVIPISISGLGLREGFFVYFYNSVGILPSISVTVSLINYFIEVLLYALIGGFVYLLQTFKIIKKI